MFRCSHTIMERITRACQSYSCYNSQLRYIGVVNSVVMWLHILVGPCMCMYVALFSSRLYLFPKSAT